MRIACGQWGSPSASRAHIHQGCLCMLLACGCQVLWTFRLSSDASNPGFSLLVCLCISLFPLRPIHSGFIYIFQNNVGCECSGQETVETRTSENSMDNLHPQRPRVSARCLRAPPAARPAIERLTSWDRPLPSDRRGVAFRSCTRCSPHILRCGQFELRRAPPSKAICAAGLLFLLPSGGRHSEASARAWSCTDPCYARMELCGAARTAQAALATFSRRSGRNAERESRSSALTVEAASTVRRRGGSEGGGGATKRFSATARAGRELS
jgi:hypothetical protein